MLSGRKNSSYEEGGLAGSPALNERKASGKATATAIGSSNSNSNKHKRYRSLFSSI
jgi:hypothetical protein